MSSSVINLHALHTAAVAMQTKEDQAGQQHALSANQRGLGQLLEPTRDTKTGQRLRVMHG